MNKRATLVSLFSLVVFGAVTITARSQEKAESQDQERMVTEKEVPPAALRTLKALAGGAPITEFAEEIEHGHTFYEGSWKRPHGNVDALVTESGDIVEMEEILPANMVPLAVRTAAEKAAGKDPKLTFEKKTMILYEVHFKKDGKGHEMVLTPDARPYHEQGSEQHSDADDTDKD